MIRLVRPSPEAARLSQIQVPSTAADLFPITLILLTRAFLAYGPVLPQIKKGSS
jgi:hypothetical protein